MGYSNYHSLKVEGNLTKNINKCPNGHGTLESKFCPECGTEGISSVEFIPGDSVIPEFREEFENSGFLIDNCGSSCGCGSGYDFEKDVTKFSKKYPDLVFIYTCQWESGLLEPGDAAADVWYIKDGVSKKAEVTVTYKNPFETGMTIEEKAEAWDKLDLEIGDFFFDEDGNERPDDYRNGLLGIGEVAAERLGYF